MSSLVVDASAEAAVAGLRTGDVITAVDGISVNGDTPESVYELGFLIPPGHDVTWTVDSGGTTTTLHARATGSLQAPLYWRERPDYVEFRKKMDAEVQRESARRSGAGTKP